MGTCIVIPAFNEELTIKSVVSDLVELDMPVFVVDDGSIDGTRDMSEKAGARVIHHSHNLGNGAALKSGLQHTFESGFNDVVTLDADGAHRSEDVKVVISAHRENRANLTIGSRFLREASQSIPSPKVDANRFAISSFNLIFRAKQTDVASGFRVLDRKAFSVTPMESSFSWTFGCLAACLREGLTVCEAPIGVRYDAQELWATSQGELEDFLNFCSQEAISLKRPIEALKQAINEGRICSVRVGMQDIFIHPLPASRQVIFQVQNQWHGAIPLGLERVDFDAAFEEAAD